jgi:hypothetical protein
MISGFPPGAIQMSERNLISVLELKRLLIELKDKRPDICFRYRMLGDLWTPHFHRVIGVTEKGVILNDEVSGKFRNIQDLSSMMQFEIDNAFHNFEPHYHYEVKPFSEW